jgi:hypothetical protein
MQFRVKSELAELSIKNKKEGWCEIQKCEFASTNSELNPAFTSTL